MDEVVSRLSDSLSKANYGNGKDTIYKYGTAGFRERADGMDFIMFRMGLLAALRSRHKKAAVGVMITASHNPICDNGVKLIDPRGEMLSLEWEDFATRVVNAPSNDDLAAVLLDIMGSSERSDDDGETNAESGVFVSQVLTARDTRPSGARFQSAVDEGARLMGAEVKDFGVVATPVLHYIVACSNDGGVYGQPSLKGYFEKLSKAFLVLRQSGTTATNSDYDPEIYFDGANGVGAVMMSDFLPFLKGSLKVQIFNEGEGTLNLNCGTDYVKSNQTPPKGVPRTPNKRIVSVDGDADRVLYSYFDEEGSFWLLDGDKIAALVAGYLKDLIRKAGLKLEMGVIQTAYANGASTRFIEGELRVTVVCVDTGVKHLHRAALRFDVGVYFEANGHGTVVFSDVAKGVIRRAADQGNTFAVELWDAISLINETVGDALSDILLVETILLRRGWSCGRWNECYADLPNQLTKVTVKDRFVVETKDAARICVKPEGLQGAIDAFVSRYEAGRAFVRASGTEDVVRVFAEARNKDDAARLCSEVASAVYDRAGGVGPRPPAL